MLQRINAWSTRKKIIAGGITAFALLVIIAAITGSEESTTSPTRSTNPPTPAPLVSARTLLDEREANATRFDDQRKGTYVQVQGRVVNIDQQ